MELIGIFNSDTCLLNSKLAWLVIKIYLRPFYLSLLKRMLVRSNLSKWKSVGNLHISSYENSKFPSDRVLMIPLTYSRGNWRTCQLPWLQLVDPLKWLCDLLAVLYANGASQPMSTCDSITDLALPSSPSLPIAPIRGSQMINPMTKLYILYTFSYWLHPKVM